MAEELSVLGRRLPRADALEKVKGEAEFIADMQLPGMLEAKFLRSPHAHARIVRIDASKAEALPGVRGMLTYKNVPKVHPRDKLGYLLGETVHCAGEEVAVVAAITKEIAEEALKLIEVEYEVLPAVFDAEEAMKPDAPLIYPEYGTNLYHGTEVNPVPRCTPETGYWLTLDVGDVDKGFAQADYVIEGNYETPIQYNCSPLPRSVICQWIGDKLTCWADNQIPTDVTQDLAKCLGIPQSKVRVVCPYPVGSYGGKEPDKIATLAALLAKRTGRPVRAVFTREEDVIATPHRPNYKTYAKIGVKRDGTITAIYNRMIFNYGKDNVWHYLQLATSAVCTCTMLYEWQNSKWEGCTVITNIIDSGAMNGFGDPEAGFCVERLIDEAAERIGMDPVEFRLKNCMRYGDKATDYFDNKVLYGTIDWNILGPDMDSFPECIRKVAEKARWKEKWKGWKTPVAVNGSKRRGIGIAIGMHRTLYTSHYAAIVKMNHDGTANVLSSAVDIGQGCRTAMGQVVAEALGLHYEDVNVILGDTTVTPAGIGIIASCGVSSAMAAAKYAAEDAKQKLFDLAAKRLGVKPDELEAKERRIYIKGRPQVGMPIAEVCLIGWQITGSAVNPHPNTIRDEKTGKTIHSYAVAATIAEVEVDTETGELNVLSYTSAHDCGRAINPTLIENQIDMSATMSNGLARTENFIIDKSMGVLLNPNLLDYKIMTILDMPKMKDMQEIFVEFPCAWGPFGAKGMSETGSTTGAPAVANAIYNAIGVRIRGDHLTPDRILEALGKQPRRY